MFDWVPRSIRWAFAVLVLAVVVWFLVIPQFGQAEDSLDAITGVHVGFVVLGAVLVAAAMAAQAELTRSVLPEPERPGFMAMVRMELATTAVSHTVPGGTAAGTALEYRLLTQAGTTGPAAGFALGVRGIGSALVLNVILWAALVVSIPTRGFDPRYTTAAVVGAVLLGAAGLMAVALLKIRERSSALLVRMLRHVPLVDEQRMPAVIDRLSEQLRDLVADRGLAIRAVGWAAAYWLGLAASLWTLLLAFGWTGDPVSMVVAFGLVNVLAAIPITPRGLGVLEAVLIPMLVGFGATVSEATLGVVSWRLLSFWAPIPLGTASYVSLRIVRPGVPGNGEASASDELAEASRSGRESIGEWAERHGLRRRSG